MEAVVLPIVPEPLVHTQLASAGSTAPTDHEIARFTEVMEGSRPTNTNTTQIQVVHQSYLNQQANRPIVSLGDTILNRLQAMGQGYQDRIRALEKRINQPVTSPAEANKLYFEVSQISIQQQMALAVTGKINKNAESLLKAQ